ncbi:hypothetical protein F5Y17DRAFT_118435 [Xylariaceae sp. FL0594]|nr:hypothetical protein F5Y17DRAFT_118435 [Xylariaceae sp. FL0594]
MATTTAQATKALSKLSLDPASATSPAPKSKAKPKKKEVVDSWEDEDISETEAQTQAETELVSPATQPGVQPGVAAPPPTPVSPSHGRLGYDVQSDSSASWLASAATGDSYGNRNPQDENGPRRPEKTDAVARRMIAGALGLRAPRMTEEQKAYDRAVREKERKRREEERESERKRKEEAERAKAAVWYD